MAVSLPNAHQFCPLKNSDLIAQMLVEESFLLGSSKTTTQALWSFQSTQQIEA